MAGAENSRGRGPAASLLIQWDPERVSDFTTIAIDLPTGCPVGHSDLW